jgi:threonine dehydratase
MPLLCGGNLDMTQLQTVLVHALTQRKQRIRLRVRIDDRPGKMADISGIISEQEANIFDVRHDRGVENLEVGDAYLVFTVETSGAEHAASIVDAIEERGYSVADVTRET